MECPSNSRSNNRGMENGAPVVDLMEGIEKKKPVAPLQGTTARATSDDIWKVKTNMDMIPTNTTISTPQPSCYAEPSPYAQQRHSPPNYNHHALRLPFRQLRGISPPALTPSSPNPAHSNSHNHRHGYGYSSNLSVSILPQPLLSNLQPPQRQQQTQMLY